VKKLEITDYLKEKIAEVRLARIVGEAVWALGSCISVAGLFFKILILIITGFSLLFVGLYLSVHYELQRLNYMHTLDKLTHHGK
jgi:hypothetical protein